MKPERTLMPLPLQNVLSRGEPAEFAHDSAFGCCGGAAIELMEVLSLAPERVSTTEV